MSTSSPKHLLFEEFAAVGKALGHRHRLELLDLLIHGERSVEQLAQVAHLPMASASQHLKALHRAGLVSRQRDGRRVLYRLADRATLDLLRKLWEVAERNVGEIDRVVDRYYRKRDTLEPLSREELLDRLREDSVVVLDVRPEEEYLAGHIPSAINLPVDELERRLGEVPSDRDIVACCRGPYCVYSYEAAERLRPHGFDVRRLHGGFLEWLAADLPVDRSRASLAPIPPPRPAGP
jgi:rhodanese-related sulfurtransferase/DNA-binding transcriptional ArsR family regulator